MSSDVAELKAEVARLKQELAKYEPSLSTRVSISKLTKQEATYLNKHVGVGGWIRTLREGGAGKLAFIKLFDGTISTELQVVVERKNVTNFDEIVKSGVGTSLFAVGQIIPSQGQGQRIEMQASRIDIVGPCDPNKYPLAGKFLTLDYLRTQGHFRARSMVLGAVARVRSALAFASHEFFHIHDFQYVHTPIITSNDCEGAGEMFSVTTLLKDGVISKTEPDGKADFKEDFFARQASLTVSGQLNVETYCLGLSNVYTFGPTFRAENSHTTRHLAEFWMIEPEIAFADLAENRKVAEAFVKHTIGSVLARCDADMAILEKYEQDCLAEELKAADVKVEAEPAADAADAPEQKGKGKPKQQKGKKPAQDTAQKDWRSVPLRERLRQVVDAQFAVVEYRDAIELLKKAVEAKEVTFKDTDLFFGKDMGSEHERYLCERKFRRPTFVINYPKGIKAFYMRQNDDGETVAAMDLLVPGVGELVGGSQREERLELLEKRMKEMHLPVEQYSWYLDLRRFGSVPHAGFGIGFDRLVCYTSGIPNIRDVIPFPRYPGSADY